MRASRETGRSGKLGLMDGRVGWLEHKETELL